MPECFCLPNKSVGCKLSLKLQPHNHKVFVTLELVINIYNKNYSQKLFSMQCIIIQISIESFQETFCDIYLIYLLYSVK